MRTWKRKWPRKKNKMAIRKLRHKAKNVMEENYSTITCMQFSDPMNCNLRGAQWLRLWCPFAKSNSDQNFFLSNIVFLCRYVFWYHFERMVNYDLPSDSSVSVKTSTSAKGMTRSILTIKEAQPEDAGNYTCKPSNAIAASIQVFVSEGRYYLSCKDTIWIVKRFV